MPSDPNKLPMPAPFPTVAERKKREAIQEKRRVGRPRKYAGPDDKWMARRMISLRIEHVHWHNIRWFANKDRVSKGEYIKNAIMLYNFINFHYPLNKRLLLDLDEKLNIYLDFWKKYLCNSEGDPMVAIKAFYEAPYEGRQTTDEEKRIAFAITSKIKEAYAQSQATSEGQGKVAHARQEGEVSDGSLAQENDKGAAVA